MGVVQYIKAMRAEGKSEAPLPGKVHKKKYLRSAVKLLRRRPFQPGH
jgi:hypothetical protein